jgi:transcriptional regulator with XRE-family HTH domain
VTPLRIKAESRIYFAALGKRICLLRKARQLTQAELARAIGVSQQCVFAWEVGDRRVSVLALVRLAQTFGTTLEELVGLDRPLQSSKRRASPRAIRNAERLQALPTTQQRFILRILNLLEDRPADGK